MTEPRNPLFFEGPDIRFDEIRAEHVRPAIEALLSEAKAQIERIASDHAPPTYASTLEALEAATERLGEVMGVVSHLESVRSEPALREAYNAVDPEVSAFFTSIPLNAGLWRALRAFQDTPEAKALPATRARFLEKTVKDMRRHGAELDEPGKARLEQISRELSELTNRYSQNLLDSTAAFELIVTDESRLLGLPDSAVRQARESAKEKGKEGWRLTLQAPSIIPALTYLDDPSIREQLHRAYQTRATSGDKDNRPIVARILALRAEQARLLGFATFADLVLEDRMAKTGQRARAFVDDLAERTHRFFERENQALLQFRRQVTGVDRPMRPWDIAYWSEKLREDRYDYDEEALRPYFPLERCLEGLFETARKLYGIKIEPKPELRKWHPDVRPYQVVDADGAHLANIFFDLFPREEKRGGAWMNGLTIGRDGDPHVAIVAANLTPPLNDVPALLLHEEVETLFHEFGHLMHHVLTKVPIRSLAGTNVAWDFVELPSQIMENWTWEREGLDLFARHHESSEPIPVDLFEKMKSARTFRAANAMMRQLGFATMDLLLHTDFEPSRDGDPVEYARRVLARFSPVEVPPEYAMAASFSHLFGSAVGYAAGYYSYKWAEVLDADAFLKFLETGLFDETTGREFRAHILERGDEAEPEVLFRAFRGREPSLTALLERSGLVERPQAPGA
ncbi:MAG: M3 family metallopeptidase [Deltaproteobacteria bacterium]|nr:M3 family metallopeptidase [Deltaproteobacteria bacterium]